VTFMAKGVRGIVTLLNPLTSPTLFSSFSLVSLLQFSFFLSNNVNSNAAGTLLCIFMILCNCSVTRIVYRSYHNMHQLTMSFENNNVVKEKRKPETILRHQLSEVSSSSNTSKAISLITRDEITFINMCNLLTASFVLCWGCQMVS
jgi:hypothetical protein